MLAIVCMMGIASSVSAQQALPGTLLVSEFTGGSVVDVLAGGDFMGKPRFATGLSSPIGLCVGPNDDIFVAEYNGAEVTKITAGGNFMGMPAFATGLSGPTVLACSSTKVYVAEWNTGRVFDITAGGSFTGMPAFATITTTSGAIAYGAAGLIIDGDGDLWYAAAAGVWNITAGGSFTNAERYATTDASGWPAGFGIIGSDLYMGRFERDVVPVTMGADLTMATAFATVPDLSGFASSQGHQFAVAGTYGGSSYVYDITGGGDFTTGATPIATGIGYSYFGGVIYYSACGDGILQVALGEECDDGSATNSDVTANACRTNCHAASCGDNVVDMGEACDQGDANDDAGPCHTDCTAACDDADSDGSCDVDDECDSDPDKSAAGDCGCGVADTDTDSDETPDCNDACPMDMAKTEAGACGCDVADTDTDSDETPDCNDACPMDMAKTEAGACGCGMPETDSDGDDTPDCMDLCANDPDKTAPGICGCSMSDEDSDNDGVAACDDVCLGRDSSGDDDDDGICNDRDDKLLVVGSSFDGEAGECGNGGVRLQIGRDGDGSTTLDDGEVEQTEYICNGSSGGSVSGNGWRITSLAAKSQQCAYGGLKVDSGTDDDADGSLEDAEVDATTIACNANGIAVRTSALAAGSGECPTGGVSIDTGVDADGDFELDTSEVQHSSVVCRAAPVLFNTETLAAGDTCPQGGVRIALGADDGAPSGTAGDGQLQAAEIDSMHPICLAGVTADDVLVDGGGSSCSVHAVGRGPSGFSSAGMLLLAAAYLQRRRRDRARS